MDDTENLSPINYVTYDETGKLTGSFFQVPCEDHAGEMLAVSEEQRANWVMYKLNDSKDGLILIAEVPASIDFSALKSSKTEQINQWRAQANQSTFPFQGKTIACDQLSRSDIDGVAGMISLTGAFPGGFPGAWKAVDNTYIVLKDADAFKAMYAAMTAQGAANFNHAQELKAQVAAATTAEDIAKIVW